uniref:GLTSCR protein conserved domain-containing protein n=1 Tax=Kalanchoe fedtschenkoi TaxID=63787 RepID=A0A7N0TBY5_KALFE
MDDAKALTQHQQQQMMIQQQQQQMLMLQQLQHQKQQAMSRFPSNIDAHLRTPGFPRQMVNPNLHQQPSPSPNPNNPNPGTESQHQNLQPSQTVAAQVQQQQRMVRPPANQTELHLAYQDAWRVCHPDYKRPFASIEDACERLLPYHVVADYEAEEDDRILDSDTTGQMLSRSLQWDNNIAAKVAEFTGTFEKQVYAFNLISRKRGQGEFRAEERLMIEQALLQEEKRAMLELRAEIESREKAGREANMRMAAMAQASQVQSQSHARAEMMARGAIRANALGSHGNDVSMGHDMGDQEHGGNPDGMMNGWGHNGQRDDEPPDDFLNDEENENGDAGAQDDDWRESGEFDLNTR